MMQYKKLVELVQNLEKDYERFYSKNNHAAGTRIRQGLQDIKNLAQEIRVAVQEHKKSDTLSEKD